MKTAVRKLSCRFNIPPMILPYHSNMFFDYPFLHAWGDNPNNKNGKKLLKMKGREVMTKPNQTKIAEIKNFMYKVREYLSFISD